MSVHMCIYMGCLPIGKVGRRGVEGEWTRRSEEEKTEI